MRRPGTAARSLVIGARQGSDTPAGRNAPRRSGGRQGREKHVINRTVALATAVSAAAVYAVAIAAALAARLAVNLIITGDGVWLVVN